MKKILFEEVEGKLSVKLQDELGGMDKKEIKEIDCKSYTIGDLIFADTIMFIILFLIWILQ